MAVLDGVDGTNDELGRQKTGRIQKAVWKGLPSPEDSHDTIFILNYVVHRFCEVAERQLRKWLCPYGHLNSTRQRELVISTVILYCLRFDHSDPHQ